MTHTDHNIENPYATLARQQNATGPAPPPDTYELNDILTKAKRLQGLSSTEVIRLLDVTSKDHLEKLFDTAREVKEAIYGKRIVLFAPLYVSNYCVNNCLYCAFKSDNKGINRRALAQDEIRQEVKTLLGQGHKRLLLVTGESNSKSDFNYLLESINTIYQAGKAHHIRRVNVNVAPLSNGEFKELARHKIGTYQIFQETYHQPTYEKMHPKGPKANFNERLATPSRAMAAGIHDVGIGVLFGLYDHRQEVAALVDHAAMLEREFGTGPHTISVPRLEPAQGSDIASQPPCPVTDTEFLKIIAALRLAVPYTGIILSTRESEAIRSQALGLGVSQISAGSRTQPGGYCDTGTAKAAAQFQLGDHRTLDEVVMDALQMGYLPSFCTGCYRKGRTGKDFMELAKPGLIKKYCLPNGLITLQEYLQDYASPKTQKLGENLIEKELNEISSQGLRKKTGQCLEEILRGKRDIYI